RTRNSKREISACRNSTIRCRADGGKAGTAICRVVARLPAEGVTLSEVESTGPEGRGRGTPHPGGGRDANGSVVEVPSRYSYRALEGSNGPRHPAVPGAGEMPGLWATLLHMPEEATAVRRRHVDRLCHAKIGRWHRPDSLYPWASGPGDNGCPVRRRVSATAR